jgi:hypothetical protein
MDPAHDYLRLVGSYCRYLGGLRWSATDDGIEYADGETFVLLEEIPLFLMGFAAHRSLIHFCHILHLLHLFRGSKRILTPEVARLRSAFKDSGRSLRNAGTFSGALCDNFSPFPGPVDVHQVCGRLLNRALPMRWFLGTVNDAFYPAIRPPLEPGAFEEFVLNGLRQYSDDELHGWLRNGRGPIKDNNLLLETLPPPVDEPRTLESVLDRLLQRPRLASAAAFVPELVGAVTLPAPRLQPQELALGGYADVATRGKPEQVLPSQFALDEWDFLRRFAENELLYFQREEPQTPVRRQLIVILDQGVRTWGNVRLALSAAVIAFGKQAVLRKLDFLLAATSTKGTLADPMEMGERAFGEIVEASDLGANPAETLARVLSLDSDAPRDVVLLTHPRNLREADVVLAAREVAAETRLFAASVDGQGEVALNELRGGAPVKLTECRLDFTCLKDSAHKRESTPLPAAVGSWTGDVEPIPFPFCFGPSNSGKSFLDFDDAGHRLLLAERDGMLFAYQTDGSSMEVLPRAMVKGAVLERIEGVVGVAGGYLVVGKFGLELVAVHYDFSQRTCRVYSLGMANRGGCHCSYQREKHSVLIAWQFDSAVVRYLVDLYSGKHSLSYEARATMHPAFGLFKSGRQLTVTDGGSDLTVDVLQFSPKSGTMRFLDSSGRPAEATPKRDGLPLFAGCEIWASHLQGDLLLTLVRHPQSVDSGSKQAMHLFRISANQQVFEMGVHRKLPGFALSRDGKRLCVQAESNKWTVYDLTSRTLPQSLRRGGFASVLPFFVSESCLSVQTRKEFGLLLRWDQAPFLDFVIGLRRGCPTAPAMGPFRSQAGRQPPTRWRKSDRHCGKHSKSVQAPGSENNSREPHCTF